jgi:phosphoserine phosphatase
VSATIYVARHGETTWNVAGRYQGRLESALSGLGVAQGAALARYFADCAARDAPLPAQIVSSPLLRCTATAQFVATQLGLPVATDERLIEIAHGTWEGRYRDELAANDPKRYHAWRNDPAHVAFERGETLGDVRERWRAFAATLADTRGDVLAVTHDAVCRVALLDALGRGLEDFWTVRVENAAFARYAVKAGALTLVEECHTDHLATLRASLEGQAL